MPIYPGTFHMGKPLFNDDGTVAVLNGDSSMQVKFTLERDGLTTLAAGDYPLMVDIFKIGLEDTDDLTSSTNNAIYRLELEEDGDNSSDFIGTLEYIGLNQVNVAELATYTSIPRCNQQRNNVHIRRQLHLGGIL